MTTPLATIGVMLINDERRRHADLGYAASHDREHQGSELTAAALCYAVASDGPTLDPSSDMVLYTWPWDLEAFHADDDPVRNLVKAGALIAAEIDRRLLAEAEIAQAGVRQQQAEEAEILVLAPGSEVPLDRDHVHNIDGFCLRDRGGKCRHTKEPTVTCPACGHRAHGTWCPNMASDNDCSCTHVTAS